MLRPNLFSCEIKKLRSTFLRSFFFCVFRARLPSARDARAMRQKRARGETHARGGTKKGAFFSAPPSCIQLFEFTSTHLKKGKNWPSFYKLNIFFSSLDFVITLTLSKCALMKRQSSYQCSDLLALSSSVLSSHCVAAVCCASPTSTIKWRARLQHLSLRIGFRLYGIALEPWTHNKHHMKIWAAKWCTRTLTS